MVGQDGNLYEQAKACSTRVEHALAQCHLLWPIPNTCINGGADPLVCGRRPRRPVPGWMRLISLAKSGSRGTRADQGVRPTIYAGFQILAKVSDIGLEGGWISDFGFRISD